MNFVDIQNVLCPMQFGFRKQHSTETVLKIKRKEEVQPDILVNGEKIQIVPEFKYLMSIYLYFFLVQCIKRDVRSVSHYQKII